MDVVDTLRHRQKLVEKELARPENDEALIGRLRQIYAAQGIEVSDPILRAGVDALREDRFAYRPPPESRALRWARVYAQRGLWARRALIVAAILVIAFAAHRALVVAPREALATDIANAHAAIAEIAVDESARVQADSLHDRASVAMSEGDLTRARADLAALQELQEQLELFYELVIASGPESAIGIWRVRDVNASARNYYLIVEAIDARGARMALPIRNEETGVTERVESFGLGVTEAAWERVAADLEDDGIIQDALVGVKERGQLEPEYLLETTGGAITRW